MYFLSASIPDPRRDPKYYSTADIIAIRDAVRALATIVIPRSHLVWGGHPAISPLIRYVLSTMDSFANEHVTMYQSLFFEREFPKDNKYFENVIEVPAQGDKENSLLLMRLKMLRDDHHKFLAGIFIGGMEGVEKEFNLFREFNSNTLILPIANTGAAARIIYENLKTKPHPNLLNDYAYMELFKTLLKIH